MKAKFIENVSSFIYQPLDSKRRVEIHEATLEKLSQGKKVIGVSFKDESLVWLPVCKSVLLDRMHIKNAVLSLIPYNPGSGVFYTLYGRGLEESPSLSSKVWAEDPQIFKVYWQLENSIRFLHLYSLIHNRQLDIGVRDLDLQWYSLSMLTAAFPSANLKENTILTSAVRALLEHYPNTKVTRVNHWIKILKDHPEKLTDLQINSIAATLVNLSKMITFDMDSLIATSHARTLKRER